MPAGTPAKRPPKCLPNACSPSPSPSPSLTFISNTVEKHCPARNDSGTINSTHDTMQRQPERTITKPNSRTGDEKMTIAGNTRESGLM